MTPGRGFGQPRRPSLRGDPVTLPHASHAGGDLRRLLRSQDGYHVTAVLVCNLLEKKEEKKLTS